MQQWLAFLMIWVSISAIFSCTPEEELITRASDVNLRFSQDTVLFDTLFTSRQSITQRLKVYNPGARAVETSIRLAGGALSPYDIYVNGQQGALFENVRLRGGDSLLILVEALIDPEDENLPFLVEDSILFQTNERQQTVKLRSWGQDAYFIKSWHIRQDTSLSADRPYVVSDSIWVQESALLRVPAGCRLYFERGGSLQIEGSLKVGGDKTQPVLFTHTRQDGAYADAPGQWQGIFFSEKSRENVIRYATIRNAEVGIFLVQADADTVPDLRISHSIIENMSINGILAANADIDGYNLLINHCAVNAVGNFGRGYYRYTHCTFANDVVPFSREGPVLFFADTLLADPQISQPFELVLQNNIVWGNRNNELRIDTELPGSRLQIRHNLLKSDEIDLPEANGSIYNEEPQFSDPVIYVYTLDSTSAAIDQGIVSFVEEDLAGNARDARPDLGAYEFIKAEEE
jgi:hypothetical protein